MVQTSSLLAADTDAFRQSDQTVLSPSLIHLIQAPHTILLRTNLSTPSSPLPYISESLFHLMTHLSQTLSMPSGVNLQAGQITRGSVL